MQFETAKPTGILSKYVKSYWGIKNLSPIKPYIHRVIPHGLPELMFYLGSKPKVSDEAKSFNSYSILSGHQKKFYDLNISDSLDLLSVTFYPHGAHLFFDVPISDSYNQNVSLNDFNKLSTQALEDKLHNTNDFAKRVMLIEHFLITLLKKNYKPYELDRITHALKLINESKGLIEVDRLAQECCLGRKQFERVFSLHIGSTPKQFLKTVRFQQALFKKQYNPEQTLTELSHENGYFDQSHMINDFKTLSGMTPKNYFKSCEPFSDYFS